MAGTNTNFINISGKSKNNKLTRADLENGQVFIIKQKLDSYNNKGGAKPSLYAHVGTSEVPPSTDKHFRSLNLTTGEEASTRNGGSEVVVVGTYEISVDLHEDFANLA